MWGRPGPGNGRGGGLPRGADGPPEGAGPGPPGGPAAAATLDASRALPVDRPSCGGRRGRARGARRVPARPPPLLCPVPFAPPSPPVSPVSRVFRWAGGWVRGKGRRAGEPGWGGGPRRSSPAGSAPRAAVPRGASPRPAPSSRLRTGADQGNPTV